MRRNVYVLVTSTDEGHVHNIVTFTLPEGEPELEQVIFADDVPRALFMGRINSLVAGMSSQGPAVKPAKLYRTNDGLEFAGLQNGGLCLHAHCTLVCTFDGKYQPVKPAN
ncbi:MAG: hypothetical protein HY975_03115 [Candidatus Kerfeldbacteria bacterium]|nr:hypothetical protein [Candidatus Kerfeldbacteria bacterium]